MITSTTKTEEDQIELLKPTFEDNEELNENVGREAVFLYYHHV